MQKTLSVYNLIKLISDGRGGEIRTPDPLVPNQMRYQTALHPVKTLLLSKYKNEKSFFNFLLSIYCILRLIIK